MAEPKKTIELKSVAGFEVGSYVMMGRFKNKPAKILRIVMIDDVVKVDLSPIPKGRKQIRTRNLFTIRKAPADKLADIAAKEALEKAERAKKTASILELFLSREK